MTKKLLLILFVAMIIVSCSNPGFNNTNDQAGDSAGALEEVTAQQVSHSPVNSAQKYLLIYYGYPSLINGSVGNAASAASHFMKYDYVVLGAGLEDPAHPDHANTTSIITTAHYEPVTFFGYISLGVTPGNNYPMTGADSIQSRIDNWAATGVNGIFFDGFGYDYATSRDRQNQAVEYAHSKGLSVVANAWNPADAFSSDVHAIYNPQGIASALSTNDYYLAQSYQIAIGDYVSEAGWQWKVGEIQKYREQIGFKVFTITTNSADDSYDQNKFYYAWYSSLLYDFEACGWGEYIFSADDNNAPYRARPVEEFGTIFTSDVMVNTSVYTRERDTGTMTIDALTHTVEFNPLQFVVNFPDPDVRDEVKKILRNITGEEPTVIYNTDCYKLEHLSPVISDARDLTGVEHCINMRDVSIFNTNISDLSPLSSLVKLKTLILSNTNVTDFSPLASLPNLTSLNGGYYPLNNFDSISQLRQLSHINMAQSNFIDISAISKLSEMQFLYLQNNPITDISAIGTLSKLQQLDLKGCSVVDLSPLLNLSNLTRLDISNNNTVIKDDGGQGTINLNVVNTLIAAGVGVTWGPGNITQ